MRKIAENDNQPTNNEPIDENLDEVSTVSDETTERNFKEKANKVKDNAKEKAKKVAKNKKVIAFIAAHFVPIVVISVLILVIIWLVGVFSFFTTMPGMILEKVKDFGKSIWGDFTGFFTGDAVAGKVTEEDIVSLAQYIQSMGYEDLESCGFGDIEYEDDDKGENENDESNESTTIKTNKQIKKINNSVDGKNYLKAYIAANESTWTLANWSVWGALNSLASGIHAAVKWDSSLMESNKSFSTGMLNILDTAKGTHLNPLNVKVDRQNEKLTIFSDYSEGQADIIGTFGYDLSSWTARYGRPMELFLSLHLSTMMPDLAYEIATNRELNTKVNIIIQDVDLKYDVIVNQSNISSDEIVNAFLDYALSGQDYQYNGGSENFYRLVLENIGDDQEKRNEFFKNIIDQIDGGFNSLETVDQNQKQLNIKETLKNDYSSFMGEIDVDDVFGVFSKYYVYIKTGTEQVPGLAGINYDDLFELALLAANGMGDGMQRVKWPYIQSVTNHWYYNDIDFTKGVYRKAKSAKKLIDYEPSNDEESALVKDNIKVQLDAVLTADEGIVYQVCEPETSGPNQTIIDIFKDQYYKYDGTAQTAKAIDNAKRYEESGESVGFEKDGYVIEEPTVEKQEVSFEENKVNPLTTFSILENMHSEEGDFVYRCLKELMLKMEFFDEEDLTEELKDVLLWLIEVGNKEEEFDITRDPNEYGILIKGVNGRKIIAPENCKISSDTDESGESIVTLTFTGLSDETVELLEYIYEDDFKIINKDSIAGVSMKIKGMTLSKTGSASRGEEIGTASGDLQIVMLDVDKSRIENVEEYMNPSHNNEYYSAIENAKNKVYGEGIDIGYYSGDGIDRGNNGHTDYFDPNAALASATVTEQAVYDALIDMGLTHAGACAVMGCMYYESSFNLNATNRADGGYGLLQWTYSRKTNLINYCNNNGLDYKSLEGQMKFFEYELYHSYSKENGYKWPVYETLTTGSVDGGVTNKDDLEECLKMFFCHAEAGYDVKLKTEGHYAETTPDSTQEMFDKRLTRALGYFNYF